MSNHFFALFSRMKYINRWSLMRNTRQESLSQHSLEVAAIAHALAVIGNRRLNKSYNAERCALMGIYHDMPEILTGDMPTPVKYYNAEIRESFGEIEKAAQKSLLCSLPDDLQSEYAPLLIPDDAAPEHLIVKAADKISALIKCVEERKSGNNEFTKAEEATLNSLKALNCPEADIFTAEFLDSFSLVLDSVLPERK